MAVVLVEQLDRGVLVCQELQILVEAAVVDLVLLLYQKVLVVVALVVLELVLVLH